IGRKRGLEVREPEFLRLGHAIARLAPRPAVVLHGRPHPAALVKPCNPLRPAPPPGRANQPGPPIRAPPPDPRASGLDAGNPARRILTEFVVTLRTMELVVGQGCETDIEARPREPAEERVIVVHELREVDVGAACELARPTPEKRHLHPPGEPIQDAAQ